MRCEAACTVAFRLLHLTDHDRLSWALKRLYGEIRHRVHLVDVVVRQNHRGPHVCPYTTLAEKMRDGQRYRAEEGIPGLAIDDLSGTTHQVSGGMADPTYLIDANGRVAFYNMWTHVPTLYCAVRELARQGGVGTVLGGPITSCISRRR